MNDCDTSAPSGATETVTERIARLEITDIGETRMALLTEAHPIVDDATFKILGDALRVSRKETVVVPCHRFENLSRGKGWARKGRGDSAVWGERTEKGYRLTVGKWTVGGNDGYSRKGEDTWVVSHVIVGAQTWTVAS